MFKAKRQAMTILWLEYLLRTGYQEQLFLTSLELSSAFYLVNMKLLLERLSIIGLPTDVIDLIEIWLNERFYYVNTRGVNSYIKICLSAIWICVLLNLFKWSFGLLFKMNAVVFGNLRIHKSLSLKFYRESLFLILSTLGNPKHSKWTWFCQILKSNVLNVQSISNQLSLLQISQIFWCTFQIFLWKTTGKLDDCFLGKTTVAKNFLKVFWGGGWGMVWGSD